MLTDYVIHSVVHASFKIKKSLLYFHMHTEYVGYDTSKRSRICNLMRRLRFQMAMTTDTYDNNNAHAILKGWRAEILLYCIYKRTGAFGILLSEGLPSSAL